MSDRSTRKIQHFPVGSAGRLLGIASFVILLGARESDPPPTNPVSTSLPGTPAIAFTVAVQTLSKDSIQVFGGVSPSKGNWDNVLVAQLTPAPGDASPNPTCTAVFVGLNVLLTAAHCVVRGSSDTPAPVMLKSSSFTMVFTCSVDTAYLDSAFAGSPRMGADYALCSIGSQASRPLFLRNVSPDTIDVTPLGANERLLATGFGCTSWTRNPTTNSFDPGPISATLTVGDVAIKAAAMDEDLVESISNGVTNPAICSGDSGGPAYSGVSVASLGATRWVRAVASSIDYVDVTSRFAALDTKRFMHFLACWRFANPNSGILLRASVRDPLIAPIKC